MDQLGGKIIGKETAGQDGSHEEFTARSDTATVRIGGMFLEEGTYPVGEEGKVRPLARVGLPAQLHQLVDDVRAVGRLGETLAGLQELPHLGIAHIPVGGSSPCHQLPEENTEGPLKIASLKEKFEQE